MYSCTLTFQTLLGSFVQRTSQNPSLHLQHRSPCFASAKVRKFHYTQHFCKTFFEKFSLFYLCAVTQRFTPTIFTKIQEKSRILLGKTGISGLFGHGNHRKISQNHQNYGKTDTERIRKNATRKANG